METGTPNQPNKAVIAVVVIALLAIIAAAVILLGKKETPVSTTSESAPAVSSSQDPPQTAQNDSNSGYKDGTYKASGGYRSPGGAETVDLTVTLAGGVVTSTDFSAHASTRDAEDYQSRFKGGYKALVVGKKIDDVSLSRVAGSSLTSGGFNQALEQIKQDAKA